MTKKIIPVRFDDETKEKIIALADKYGVTVSDIIRYAVKELLKSKK